MAHIPSLGPYSTFQGSKKEVEDHVWFPHPVLIQRIEDIRQEQQGKAKLTNLRKWAVECGSL